MHFLSRVLEEYIENNSENEPQLLQNLSKETHLKVLQPRMLTGHFQGRVLSMLSKIINPKYILEIGTYTGYSALCLAEGLQKYGQLHTIEINEELHEFQRKYFDTGNALDIIPALDFQFDLVFIDAEKTNYEQFFEAAITKTKSGGIILSDNVLWSGKVIDPLNPKDKATKALIDYNLKLKEDSRVETVLFPIRDGLTVCRVL